MTLQFLRGVRCLASLMLQGIVLICLVALFLVLGFGANHKEAA